MKRNRVVSGARATVVLAVVCVLVSTCSSDDKASDADAGLEPMECEWVTNNGITVCACEGGYVPQLDQCVPVQESFGIDSVVPASGAPGGIVTIHSSSFQADEEYLVWFGKYPTPAYRVHDGTIEVGVPLAAPGPQGLFVQKSGTGEFSNAVDFEILDFSFEPMGREELALIFEEQVTSAVRDIGWRLDEIASWDESPFPEDLLPALHDGFDAVVALLESSAATVAAMPEDEARLLAGALQESGVLDVLAQLSFAPEVDKLIPGELYLQHALFLSLDFISFVVGNVNAVLSLVSYGCLAAAIFTEGGSLALLEVIGPVHLALGVLKSIIDVLPVDLVELYAVKDGAIADQIQCVIGADCPVDFRGDFEAELSPAEAMVSMTLDTALSMIFSGAKHLLDLEDLVLAVVDKIADVAKNNYSKVFDIAEIIEGHVPQYQKMSVPYVPVLLAQYDRDIVDLLAMTSPAMDPDSLEVLLEYVGIDDTNLVDVADISNPDNLSFDVFFESFTGLQESTGNSVEFSGFRFVEQDFYIEELWGFTLFSYVVPEAVKSEQVIVDVMSTSEADWEPCTPSEAPTGTWCDETTGFLWENPPSFSPTHHWDAVARCQEMTLGGYLSWRMPSIGELRTLVRGCPNIETGGECSVDDDCLDEQLCDLEPACDFCGYDDGPGVEGCYWPDELIGSCSCYWSFSVVQNPDYEFEEGHHWQMCFDGPYFSAFFDDIAGLRIRCVVGP